MTNGEKLKEIFPYLKNDKTDLVKVLNIDNLKSWWNAEYEEPTTTPIRSKGHWIKIGDRGFGYSDIVICKCSECEEQEELTGKFDGHNLVIDMERADNYCSNCGADMREVQIDERNN